jgi:hypothetical protein
MLYFCRVLGVSDFAVMLAQCWDREQGSTGELRKDMSESSRWGKRRDVQVAVVRCSNDGAVGELYLGSVVCVREGGEVCEQVTVLGGDAVRGAGVSGVGN